MKNLNLFSTAVEVQQTLSMLLFFKQKSLHFIQSRKHPVPEIVVSKRAYKELLILIASRLESKLLSYPISIVTPSSNKTFLLRSYSQLCLFPEKHSSEFCC